jgi:arabinogalactan oligomer/maltooligosaccharide transport system permease protein
MDKQNNADKKRGFLSAFANFFKKIGNGFANFFKRFADGSVYTKISHLIMGFGNLARGQITKGLMFLLIQVGFIYFMIVCPEVNRTPLGYKAILNLKHLGTNAGGFQIDPVTGMFTVEHADNSMLMLLFGVVTIGLFAMFLIVWLSSIGSSYKVDIDKRNGKKPTNFVQDAKVLLDEKFHVLLLTPALVGIILFTVLPTIFMILVAFTNMSGTSLTAGTQLFTWTGFENFASIFRNNSEIGARFLPVLGWTLIWAFFATFTNYIGGILLALLINKKGIKAKKIWRTIFVLTIALPQFISLLAMRNLLSEYGPVNQLLVNLHLIDNANRIKFLGTATNPWVARFTIIAINIWIGVPYTMLMTTGILMNVPTELYEAAQIDGATKRKAFRYITIPYILFVTTPYLITSFIGNITNFNVIFFLTNGGPNAPGFIAGKTDLLVTWLYKLTMTNDEFNIGAVVGIMTFLVTATATLLSYRRSKSYKEEDAFQ